MLANLHNNGDIDLLEIVTHDSIQPFQGHTFWNGQQFYCALICRLQASAEVLLKVVQVFVETAGQDLVADTPYNEFSKWCGLEPSRPKELLDLIDRKLPNVDRFVTIAIKQGVVVDRQYFLDRAYGFLMDGTETEKQAVIIALGQIPCQTDEEWDHLISTFSSHLTGNDAFRASLITAIAQHLHNVPADHHEALARLGIIVVQQHGDCTLDAAARTLANDLEYLPEAFIDELLGALLAIEGKNIGTIKRLDWALAKLVKQGRVEQTRRYLEQLLRRKEDCIDFKDLESFWDTLRDAGGQVLDDWVVSWLLGGEYALCSALNDALFDTGSDKFVFQIDFTHYSFTEADYPYLARKAISTFFMKKIPMASFLVSLLRTASSDTTDTIIELLVDPILINYSGIVDEYLKPIAENGKDPAHVAVQRALSEKDAYFESLSSIGTVPELHPSEHQRQLERQLRADSITKAARTARQKSVFASIIRESTILYGKRAVVRHKNIDNKQQRTEASMKSIIHSFEIPFVNIIDPIGLQMMLLNFRLEGRPQ